MSALCQSRHCRNAKKICNHPDVTNPPVFSPAGPKLNRCKMSVGLPPEAERANSDTRSAVIAVAIAIAIAIARLTIVAIARLTIVAVARHVRMSQRIRRFLRRWQPRSVIQAVSLWRTKEAKAGKVAAQWDRPLMRRGRACKTLRD